ncbi:response regulator [bacterium]|nr:response regulator [bacterium]
MTKGKILVVEDEHVTALDIQNTLENMGYNVLDIASSGEEALEKIAHIKPDLVLMDIVLKGELDGIETARQIKNHHDVPFVYLTAYADDETLKRAKATAPLGYIIKPYGERELHTTVEMALYSRVKGNILKEREKKYRNIVEGANDGITIIKDRIIKYANPRFAEMCGFENSELVGKQFTDFFHERELPNVKHHDRQRHNGKEVASVFQTKLVHKKGNKLKIELNIVEIPYENSHADLVIIRDLTKRKS